MMPTLNTQIDIVKQAFKGKLISEATDREISQKLTYVYMLIGLRPQHFPTQEQDIFLFSYIRANYGPKTLDEIVLAFDQAIKGNLDLDDYKVYDQFTVEYFVRIMNAYRKWLKSQFANYKQEPEPKQIEKVEITREEKLQDIQEWETKQEIKFDYIPPFIYDYLVEEGKIVQSEEDKIRLYKRATNYLMRELKREAETRDRGAIAEYNRFQLMQNEGFIGIKQPDVNRITLIAKKIAVYDYLQTKKQENDN